MKRFLAFFLAIQFSSSHVAAQEVFRLPILIEHCYHHVVVDGESFEEFIHEHYSHHHEQDETNHAHNGLPFKNCDVQAAFSIVTVSAGSGHQLNLDFHLSLIAELKLLPNIETESADLPDVWQPPKLG